jgi:hypothetical protein
MEQLQAAPQRRTKMQRFFRAALFASLILIVVGFVRPDNGLFFTIVGLFWVAMFFVAIMRTGHRAICVATRPIPTLDEIGRELTLRGYTPSFQDCATAQAILKSERNEALVVAGGLIVGAHLLGRQAAGKPLL